MGTFSANNSPKCLNKICKKKIQLIFFPRTGSGTGSWAIGERFSAPSLGQQKHDGGNGGQVEIYISLLRRDKHDWPSMKSFKSVTTDCREA